VSTVVASSGEVVDVVGSAPELGPAVGSGLVPEADALADAVLELVASPPSPPLSPTVGPHARRSAPLEQTQRIHAMRTTYHASRAILQ
jgi:hypothetical protein